MNSLVYFDSGIHKWVKISSHRSEYEFWTFVFRQRWDVVWKTRGIVVPSSLSMTSKSPFLFTMEMKHSGKPLSLGLDRSQPFPRHLLTSFWNIYEILQHYQIVHGDIHLHNLLYQDKTSSLSLVDFGMASLSKRHNPLHEYYRWSREDLFRFFCSLFHHYHSNQSSSGVDRSEPQIDFRKERKRWKLYFRQHPSHWTSFQLRFERWFLWDTKTPIACRTLLTRFLQEVLINKKRSSDLWTSSSSTSHSQQWILKLLLERFTFLFQIFESVSSSSSPSFLSHLRTFLRQKGLS